MPLNLDNVLEALPEDRIEAAEKLLGAVVNGAQSATREELYEAMGIWEAFAEANELELPEYHPTDWGREALIATFRNLHGQHQKELQDRRTRSAVERGRDRFAMKSGKLFVYEFPESDVAKIQEYINELRGLFASSEELTEEHRSRLLRRLEQLQSELHKTMSDLDRFWGLVGDAGVAIRKFGEDSKNAALIVALIYKLTMIVWRAQLSAHGLPYEPTPLLPAPIISTPTETIEKI